MANPKLTIEFMPSGASELKFSAITGITPGKLDRASLQARKELKRLCGLAGVEARRKKDEKEEADERASEAEAEAKAATEAVDEEEDVLDEEEEPVTGS